MLETLTAVLVPILTSEAAVKVAGVVVTALVGLVGRKLLKDADQTKLESQFKWAVDIAYHAVSEVSRVTKTTADDKVALGLDYLRKAMASRGAQLTNDDTDRARIIFQAMHAREKAGLDPRLGGGK